MVVHFNKAPGFLYSEPVGEDQDKQITTLRLANGYYQGQKDSTKICGTGVFMWDTGEFYFGQWDNGAQNVVILL
jgi:hypothetical protein